MISGKKPWFISLLVFTAILIGAFFVKVRPLLIKSKELASQYSAMIVEKQNFLSRPEGPPTQKLIKETEEKNQLLQNVYTEGMEKLDLEKPSLLPENIARPSIHWLDVLRRTRNKLSTEAKKSNVEIPANLSFGDDIPSDEEVPELLYRLVIVEEILTIAIENRLKSITNIQLGIEGTINSSGKPFLRKLPLNFSVTGNIESLVSFVYSLQEAKSFFVIEDISITSKEKMLEANLVVSVVRTHSYNSEDELG